MWFFCRACDRVCQRASACEMPVEHLGVGGRDQQQHSRPPLGVLGTSTQIARVGRRRDPVGSRAPAPRLAAQPQARPGPCVSLCDELPSWLRSCSCAFRVQLLYALGTVRTLRILDRQAPRASSCGSRPTPTGVTHTLSVESVSVSSVTGHPAQCRLRNVPSILYPALVHTSTTRFLL